ncbi:MAG: UDP-N-acetylmuramoyl-L-alanyl-D-glutamate--2,6-diaminopimelate ligase [Saprospiraceae bacterium]
MKKLADIIQSAKGISIYGSDQVEINNFTLDSRKVDRGFMFIAKKGLSNDGHKFIDSAIELGGTCILCEILPDNLIEGITYVQSNVLNQDLVEMLKSFYADPSTKIQLVGITGTNGKTTTATLLYELFKNLGFKCGLISTVRNLICDEEVEATHTTPDIVSLFQLLHAMVTKGCTYVFMEVSSHAIDQDRIAGLHYTGAVFTNITHDHLDYHKTFKNYIQAKKKFFDHLDKQAFALINADDVNGAIMIQNSAARKYTYGILNMSDYKGKILENSLDGLHIKINQHELHSILIGEFNAYNLVSVYATAELLGMKEEEILIGLSALKSVEGRFDWFQNVENKKIGIVDYAHTPDALEKILNTIRKIKKSNQSIITVVGCGGNRDKTKRPQMAAIAVELSDKIIFTADNPRDEDPLEILREMEGGVRKDFSTKYISIPDREQAIKTACLLSNYSDIILVAGKGHEKYQDVKGIKYSFDDKEKLKTFLLN